MRAVVQRVKEAGVKVNEAYTGRIGKGYLVFLGVEQGDTDQDLQYLAEKIVYLRIFEDDWGKLNRSILDIGGSVLLVSQFTLLGDCRRGRRPSFSQAAAPEIAQRLYEDFGAHLQAQGLIVEYGVFQSHMEVELVNDGPVTLLLDSRKAF